MVKFDDVLTVGGDGVVAAKGPFDPATEEIIELCAWVYQRDASGNEVAATEMTGHHGGEGELTVSGDRWNLPLATVGQGDVGPGEAFAVAVAAIKETETSKQRVIWWGHPVMLNAA
jgi:hypothetical protein